LIENQNGEFIERTCHRALGLVLVLRAYGKRIGVKVCMMGTDISIMLGTLQAEKVQGGALME